MSLLEQLQQMLRDETHIVERVGLARQRRIDLEQLALVDDRRKSLSCEAGMASDELEVLELEVLELEQRLGMG